MEPRLISRQKKLVASIYSQELTACFMSASVQIACNPGAR